jgi:heme-dependent oxidative N-demethylase alpha subunit-like protein
MAASELHKPFAIGLSPLGDLPWLIVDERLPDYIAEKRALYRDRTEKVFVAEPETDDAQRETLERVASWQLTHHPGVFARASGGIRVAGSPEPVASKDEPPLLTAALLCAEDLVIMRRGEDGWRLAAASLSFPSSWRLAEKFARPITAIHKPVPGFSEGTRNATLVERIFDNLAADTPVLRGNWSIYGDDRLHHPDADSGEGTGMHDRGSPFLREERQTLTRLPGTGDILFTILISLTPLADLAGTEDGRSKARTLSAQLAAMSEPELGYKSLSGRQAQLTALLDRIGRGTI